MRMKFSVQMAWLHSAAEVAVVTCVDVNLTAYCTS